ncbi:hypothetical protein ACFYPC_25755 [Streptomyces sp. NPDC005808]|uniref:hypothetical protein n=1 Tax=Streptomyces sp. NPDC005808 TaxID=3364734 RepID=UPI0036B37228
MTRTLALVENPLQFLNLLEWALGEHDGAPDPDRCEAAVLLPRDPAARHQLGVMARLARAEGIGVGLYDIRRVPVGFPRAPAALVAKLAGAERLVIGDPFSKMVQRLLPLARRPDLVLVDDGTATLELSRGLLADSLPPVRRHRKRPASAAAVRLARRIAPEGGGHLEVFSCRPADLELPPGSITSVNTYSWARQRYGPPQVHPGVDLLGSSLAETGHIDFEHYIRAVISLADQVNAERYFADRREDPDKLRLIAEHAELDIVRPELPLELELLKGPVANTLISLSSTLHTLPLVLAGTGVEVTVHPEVAHWLEPGRSQRSAAFLEKETHT